MLNVYAATAEPVGAAILASTGHEAPKGTIAVVAVVLMFGILCGGIFMLLQSSFGAKIGYLITGTAFWGCWFVLAILWWTGVPGFPVPDWTRVPDVPTSTPQYTGPQGTAPSWVVLDTDAERREYPTDESLFVEIDPDLTNQNLMSEITAAETAASEVIGPAYAEELGVEESALVAGQTFRITGTEVIREDRKVTRARVTTGPAEVNATLTEDQKAIIAKVQPKTFLLALEEGSLAKPTYVALVVTFLLFVLHALGLAYVEMRATPQPAGVPERNREGQLTQV